MATFQSSPGSLKTAFVLNFGVAVKAKKLKFSWRGRFSISRIRPSLALSECTSFIHIEDLFGNHGFNAATV